MRRLTAAVALPVLLAAAHPDIGLTLKPWTGAALPTASHAARTFRLVISGPPGSVVTLAATGVASGWLAAFCTPKLCSPYGASLVLPSSGRFAYQFELIRQDPNASAHSGARITGGGAALDVPPGSAP